MITRSIVRMKLLQPLRLLVVGLFVAGAMAAQALQPLQGRDINGHPVAADATEAVFEYDPNLNITWLRNWNANGANDFPTQFAWAQGLGYFGGGWRLPKLLSTIPAECLNAYGIDLCNGTEMGYLAVLEMITPVHPGPFQNMQTGPYWIQFSTGKGSCQYLYVECYIVDPTTGTYTLILTYYPSHGAVAVRNGDVAKAGEGPPPSSAIPTLAQWSLVALILMLALTGASHERRANERG